MLRQLLPVPRLLALVIRLILRRIPPVHELILLQHALVLLRLPCLVLLLVIPGGLQALRKLILLARQRLVPALLRGPLRHRFTKGRLAPAPASSLAARPPD